MAISFVSADSVASASITIPTTQAGDTHLIFAFRSASNTALAVDGFALLISQASSAVGGFCQVYMHIDTGQAVTIDTALADHIARVTYRSSVSQLVDRGGVAGGLSTAADRAMVYPVLSGVTTRSDFAESWIVRCLMHKSSDVEGTPPSGYTRRILSQPGSVGTIAIYDTASAVAVGTVGAVTVTETAGTIAGRFTQSVEICETGFSFGGGSGGGFSLSRVLN
jgi:hypothetical protein